VRERKKRGIDEAKGRRKKYKKRSGNYGETERWRGVCSIFLRVDESINEIHKLRALFSAKVFNKKYVFIYY
jgi:hypothetical protein